MSSLGQSFRLLAVVATTFLLAACNFQGLGHGNTLTKLDINHYTALADNSTNVSYVCFADKLQLVGTFHDGGQADYSSRARWSSSDPTVVQVSNGDILIPGSTNLAYASGTIIPKSVGTATISATFVGLQASYSVEIHDLPSSAITLSDSAIKLIPGSTRALKLSADVDGYTIDVTQAATWSLVDSAGAAYVDTYVDSSGNTKYKATIGTTSGVVTGNDSAAGLTARADFPLCANADGSTPRRYTAAVDVENAASLELAVDPGFGNNTSDTANTDNNLIVGTREVVTTTAKFADGTSTQDVSGVVHLNSSDTAVIGTIALAPPLLTGLAAGTADVFAYLGTDPNDPAAQKSNTVTIHALEGSLNSLDFMPKNTTITSYARQQFTATGIFTLADGTTTLTQPVTNDIGWGITNSDDSATTLASIGTGFLYGNGQVVSYSPKSGDFKVSAYATLGDGTKSTQSTTLCVRKPGDSTACPTPTP